MTTLTMKLEVLNLLVDNLPSDEADTAFMEMSESEMYSIWLEFCRK
jgi:hypothetical protein